MWELCLMFGAIVGFSLGLTGGGGAIFAVPLLVYGLNVPSREAVGVSLVTVGATALVGFLQRARNGLVEYPTALLFAVAGMLTAPIGAWISRRIPESLLLLLFCGLMLVIAVRMWTSAKRSQSPQPQVGDAAKSPGACQRDNQGRLRLTSRCALLLLAVGLATGILTGLFGVGGGFLIVPALVAFSRMDMPKAIGSSLLVVTLVSSVGVATHFLAGNRAPAEVVAPFIAGGVGGLFAGTALAKRLAGPRLQKAFAVMIAVVAAAVIGRSMLG